MVWADTSVPHEISHVQWLTDLWQPAWRASTRIWWLDWGWFNSINFFWSMFWNCLLNSFGKQTSHTYVCSKWTFRHIFRPQNYGIESPPCGTVFLCRRWYWCGTAGRKFVWIKVTQARQTNEQSQPKLLIWGSVGNFDDCIWEHGSLLISVNQGVNQIDKIPS